MRIINIVEEQQTLEEAMREFLAYKQAQQIAARTMRDYKSYLADFLANSSNSLDYKTLTNDTVNYFASIPDTSPARYNHPYQCMSAFFNWAIKQDIITKNPITQQGLHKKRDDGNIKPAAIEDVKIMLNSWDRKTFTGLRNYTIILLMLDTGIRTSELVNLTDADFDSAAKQITVSKLVSKTRRNRVLYLSNTTAAALNSFLKVKPAGFSEYLFPTREGNKLRTEGLALEFNRQSKKIGVKFTPYQLRHSFATYFVQNGGDIFTLQDLMGHSDIRMTRRYTEIDGEMKRKQHNTNTPINQLSGAPRLTKI